MKPSEVEDAINKLSKAVECLEIRLERMSKYLLEIMPPQPNPDGIQEVFRGVESQLGDLLITLQGGSCNDVVDDDASNHPTTD